MPKNIHYNPFVIRPSVDLVMNHPELLRRSQALTAVFAEGNAIVNDEYLKTIGSFLWNLLDIQASFDAAVKEAGMAILPVIIQSNNADIQALPWETLYHPVYEFLGRNPAFTLTRRISEGKINQSKFETGPLRVLLFTSLPADVDADMGRLNVEDEQAQVQEALMPWIANGVVQLEMPDDGMLSTLKERLQRFDPHVVFLSGHGKMHHKKLSGTLPYGEFLFENSFGETEKIRDEELAKVFIGTHVQVVILLACESGKGTSEALSIGLMQRISAQGIPHVIGIREMILDRAGIRFARVLCDELAGQERIDVALQAARIAIQTPFEEIQSEEMNEGEGGSDFGQWCLPMALSPNPEAKIIDWNFSATPSPVLEVDRLLNTVSIPARFIGRRKELRQYKKDLVNGKIRKLLITGPGGQGKTSLASKFVLDLHSQGFEVFTWRAEPGNWRNFEFRELELALDNENANKLNRLLERTPNSSDRVDFLIDLLLTQFKGKVIFFFDNLESIQDPDTLQVTDNDVRAFLSRLEAKPTTRCIITSRWHIPDWIGEHLSLSRTNYGDFLQIAIFKKLFIQREQMHRVYDTLGGNLRGLEFFAAAVKVMSDEGEDDFLQILEMTKGEMQIGLTIIQIYKHLPSDARKLLARLPVYHEPVPEEGLTKLGLDLSDPEMLLERLKSVSLLETSYDPHWEVVEYEVSPMVTDWMKANHLVSNNSKWLNIAAEYHVYMLFNERNTFPQAITTYNALRRAGLNIEAEELILNHMLKPLSNEGRYKAMIDEWIPALFESEDFNFRALAYHWMGLTYLNLGNYIFATSEFTKSLMIEQVFGGKTKLAERYMEIGISFQYIGQYEEASSYYESALSFSRELGDKFTEGAVLINISQLYQAQSDYETAFSYLKQAIEIYREIGDNSTEGVLLSTLATNYFSRGDPNTALKYANQSLIIRRQLGDKKGEANVLSTIGACLTALHNIEAAEMSLRQAIDIQNEIGDRAGISSTLLNLGGLYSEKEEYIEARDAYINAYFIASRINYAPTLNYLAKMSESLGLPANLEIWELLAVQSGHPKQMDIKEQFMRKLLFEFSAVSETYPELMELRQFMDRVASYMKISTADAQKYLESESKMALGTNPPLELVELGEILKGFMDRMGTDLSGLFDKMRMIVEIEENDVREYYERNKDSEQES